VLDRFELPAQDLSIVLRSYDSAVTPLPKPATPPPLPLPSPRYTSHDVSIRTDDGVSLAGTLTLPNSAATPLPGFVLVHGSGCNDRDETIGPNKIFAQLANRLSNDGYAVLRYDKRSCGKSGGKFPLRDRLIADARDAIAYLRSQPGIDPKRIYVLGHSEGGELAPSIAIADGHLRGIVLLAPPALPLEQILEQQLLRNVSNADRAATEKQVQAELDAIASGKKPSATNRWLQSSFGVDPAALIVRVPCPILILQGTKDIQVLPADTPRLVQAAQNAHRDVTVVMLQDDDHLFIKLPADEPSTGGEYFTPSYLDPALFAAIESWLGLQTSGRARLP
jgi:dienelactone hydrolase